MSDPLGGGAGADFSFDGQIAESRADDGALLRYRYWPADSPCGSAVYVHGIAGHSLWFSSAATRLAESGITVYAADRRGSGLNAGREPGHVDSYEIVLADIDHFVRFATSQHSGSPPFLLAGCWGAKAGVVYSARSGAGLAGLALIAPALSVRVTLPLMDKLAVALSLALQPRRRFTIPLRPEDYTENARFRELVASDPLRLRTASARFFFETARLDRLAARAAPSIHVPTLLMCGGRDVIVQAEGLQRWFERLGTRDRVFKLYPEFAHILEFEEDRDRYVDDLIQWLQRPLQRDERVPAGQ